jgi:hypothetical protein
MPPASLPFRFASRCSCRALLLSLTDLEIIERGEAVSILEDAAAHRGAIAEAKNPQAYQAAADVIDRIHQRQELGAARLIAEPGSLLLAVEGLAWPTLRMASRVAWRVRWIRRRARSRLRRPRNGSRRRQSRSRARLPADRRAAPTGRRRRRRCREHHRSPAA